MAKRFTDTEKWTKNKWFRLLPTSYKLFWLYILDNCDCVGVWEEDVEFFCNLTGEKITKEEALIIFEDQIMVMSSGKKWWIIDFVMFQYGELKEENIKNKPHQKYISELKSHRLWIDYTKTIYSPQEKEKEKEEEKEEEKEGGVGETKTIEERHQEFSVLVLEHLDYPLPMLKEFIRYWTEHSPNGKKMRFEKEKVFDISRRLVTWNNNEQKFNKPGKPSQPSKIEQAYANTEEAKQILKQSIGL